MEHIVHAGDHMTNGLHLNAHGGGNSTHDFGTQGHVDYNNDHLNVGADFGVVHQNHQTYTQVNPQVDYTWDLNNGNTLSLGGYGQFNNGNLGGFGGSVTFGF